MGAALLLVVLAAGAGAQAQDLEPRAYANAPVGLNFPEIHVQAERKDPDAEDTARMQGDDSPGDSPAAGRATRRVQRACGRTTKYPGKRVLHDFSTADAGLRRT